MLMGTSSFYRGKQFAALQLQNLATVWRQHALNDLMEKEVKVRESKDMRPQVGLLIWKCDDDDDDDDDDDEDEVSWKCISSW